MTLLDRFSSVSTSAYLATLLTHLIRKFSQRGKHVSQKITIITLLGILKKLLTLERSGLESILESKRMLVLSLERSKGFSYC